MKMTCLTLLCAILSVTVLAAEEAVAARVNGQPIYERTLNQALPNDAYGAILIRMKAIKLERTVGHVLLQEFLAKEQIAIDPAAVEAALAEHRKNPPAAGCACCRFSSLEQYLEQNFYTLDEYREELRLKLGFEQFLEHQWKKAYPDAVSLAAAVQQRRAAVKAEYFKTWHIFFTDTPPVGAKQQEPMEHKAQAAAAAAWERLQKGESFATLVKELSADKVNAPTGGFLGYVSRERSPYGAQATAALAALKPGTYSQPVASPWGYHIFRREALTDDDIAVILKEDFLAAKEDETLTTIHDGAKIEYAAPYASALQ